MQFRYLAIHNLLLYVGIAGLLGHISIAYAINPLKYLVVLTQFFALFCAISIIYKNLNFLDIARSFNKVIFISSIPFIVILADIYLNYNFQNFTYGFFLIGQYYLLPLVGLAIACVIRRDPDGFEGRLRQFIFPMSLFVGALAVGGFIDLSAARVVSMYTVYDNLLIPASMLIFLAKKRIHFLLGFASLISIVLFCALQGSRSYMLVSLYIFIFYFSFFLINNKISPLIRLAVPVAGILFAPLFGAILQSILGFGEGALESKLRLDSLLPTLRNFLATGDFLALYFWEGNSRSEIILDAFHDFSTEEYFWGKGIFATYVSFIERSTIEVGLAQELFRYGGIYVFIFIFISLSSAAIIFFDKNIASYNIRAMLSSIIIVRILDYMIYGMPTYSVYSLLFWTAVMYPSTRIIRRVSSSGVGGVFTDHSAIVRR